MLIPHASVQSPPAHTNMYGGNLYGPPYSTSSPYLDDNAVSVITTANTSGHTPQESHYAPPPPAGQETVTNGGEYSFDIDALEGKTQQLSLDSAYTSEADLDSSHNTTATSSGTASPKETNSAPSSPKQHKVPDQDEHTSLLPPGVAIPPPQLQPFIMEGVAN